MFGQVHAVKSILVSRAVKLQSLVIKLRQGFAASADVIKKADLHLPCSTDRVPLISEFPDEAETRCRSSPQMFLICWLQAYGTLHAAATTADAVVGAWRLAFQDLLVLTAAAEFLQFSFQIGWRVGHQLKHFHRLLRADRTYVQF